MHAVMTGEMSRIVGEDLRAQVINREIETAHRLAPWIERPARLDQAAGMSERGDQKGHGIDEARAQISALHEIRDREFVAPMPEMILPQEVVPEANAPIARTKRQRMFERRAHLLELPRQEVNMADIGQTLRIRRDPGRAHAETP